MTLGRWWLWRSSSLRGVIRNWSRIPLPSRHTFTSCVHGRPPGIAGRPGAWTSWVLSDPSCGLPQHTFSFHGPPGSRFVGITLPRSSPAGRRLAPRAGRSLPSRSCPRSGRTSRGVRNPLLTCPCTSMSAPHRARSRRSTLAQSGGPCTLVRCRHARECPCKWRDVLLLNRGSRRSL